MGREYSDALDMFVDEQRTFIGALQNNKDLSIVIHGTGSPVVPTAQEIALYFATNKDELSSHFVIDRTGKVVQCVSLQNGAAANCCLEDGHDTFWDKYNTKYANLNKCTISIEHCNDVTNSLPLTPAQLAASIKLLQYLTNKFNIPLSRIKTHASIDPQTRKECPGNYPMSDVLQALQPSTKSAPTVSETTIAQDLAKAQADVVDLDHELALLRGMVIVNQPTVIQ